MRTALDILGDIADDIADKKAESECGILGGLWLSKEASGILRDEITKLRAEVTLEREHLEQMTSAANQLHSEMRASRDAIDWLICNADDQPEWVRDWVRNGFPGFPSK